MPYLYIGSGLLLIIIAYVLFTYNGLVKLKNAVNESFATMDVYLKKRWDLIPNLVETVKGYASHEKSTIESIINLRNKAYETMSLNDKIKTSETLTQGVSKLMLLAESYPDLKANENFLNLSKQLMQIEDDIANSRKYFNAVVRNLNNKVQMFPSNIVAMLFHVGVMKMFEVSTSDERESTKVAL